MSASAESKRGSKISDLAQIFMDERGATAVEYGLIAALVSLA